MTNVRNLLIFASLIVGNSSLAAAPLTEIVVTAELSEASVMETPNSVSVVDQLAIERRSAQHLEDLLNLAPNVNYASGASRGRFVQIRGIGERSEFQEPIINSVGVIVDGIDLTGIATAASMLDVKQVEILRGPQGTLYGANALAGLINIVSNDPTQDFYSKVSVAAEDYGGLQLGGTLSGPIDSSSAFRLAVNHYQSDGFVENVLLARDDTNDINETSARARYSSQLTDALQVDVAIFIADIDNGYDAFSLDNTRQTYSDKPGRDSQDTIAASLNATYEINETMDFEASLSTANSDLEYSYDEDWSHPAICDNTVCDSELFGFDWFYVSTDSYLRENDNSSIDLRLVSEGDSSVSWVAGFYHRDQSIDLQRVYTFSDTDFSSQLDTRNTALYSQVDVSVAAQWSLSTGLRVEKRTLDYIDNNGAQANPDENLWGGRIALEYRASDGAYYYGLISRGYKPGGFNLDASITRAQREFETESMVNYEIGMKTGFLDDALQLRAVAFYQDRDSIQTKQSLVTSIATGQADDPCPCSFADFTDNASSGSNSGLEVELNWLGSDRINLFASLGLLHTRFDNYLSFEHINADRDNGIPFNLAGREQAHAPGYQWVIGMDYVLAQNWRLSGSVEGKDEFFFSERHDTKSEAYQLFNLELAYERDNWQVAVYGKNINNELIATRGFGSFGNDPRKFYQIEPYNQFAAPRVLGIKASMEF